MLSALGDLLRYILAKPEPDLLGINAGERISTDFEEIALVALPEPPTGFPREEEGFTRDSSKEQALKTDPISDWHPRDIIVTCGNHGQTMFGKRIQRMQDLPADALPKFRTLSRCPDVLEIHLGRFTSKGRVAKKEYRIELKQPKEGMGIIHGKLRGPGRRGTEQQIEIKVTRNREGSTLAGVERLLETEQEPS